jgi:hypothetical protein
MSFINWGHETPEQRELRRKIEERMLFEQAMFNAAKAAAAVGSGGNSGYAISGRSSMSSFYEDGEYKYYTYNYDTDTLNKTYSTGINSYEYSDNIYVLQDKGFVLRYRDGNLRTYIFTDINGKQIKRIDLDTSQYLYHSREYLNGVQIYLVNTNQDGTLTIYLFDGEKVTTNTISDISLYPWGQAEFSVYSMSEGITAISWRSLDGSTYHVGMLNGGEVVPLDSISSMAESWYIDCEWNSNFFTVIKADSATGKYQSFKVFSGDGSLLKNVDITGGADYTSLRRNSFYGKNKYFFILGGGTDNSNMIYAYDYATNSVIDKLMVDSNNHDLNEYFHYHDAEYPSAMSDYDGDGIIGTPLRNNLMIVSWNFIGTWYDGQDWWYHTDRYQIFTLFEGDTEFFEWNAIDAGVTAFQDWNQRVIRSFSEDNKIVLDGFTWNPSEPPCIGCPGRGTENLQRIVFGQGGTVSVVATGLTVDSVKIFDKFFLGSKLVYRFYLSGSNQEYWLVVNSDAMTNPQTITIPEGSDYFRSYDTLVIIDSAGETTYSVSGYNTGNEILNLNIETGVWYNQAFLSDKNGDESLSPTTEYSYYPNNVGWGSIVLVHDTGVNEPDYGKAIILTRTNYSQFTLPMFYGNPWYGELGRETFLFAWEDGNNLWQANLYDLEGTLLQHAQISQVSHATDYYNVDLWNLNDRAIINIKPDSTVDEYYHIHFSPNKVTSVNVGPSDYWWENDYPAWYW